jgi:hypothetical protein
MTTSDTKVGKRVPRTDQLRVLCVVLPELALERSRGIMFDDMEDGYLVFYTGLRCVFRFLSKTEQSK